MKQTSWWHVFQVRNKKASVIAKNDYKLTGDIEMAIEAGPRLLTDGTIPEGLKPSSSDRTALGITKDGKIVIVVTENYSLSMADLAKRLRSTGCINALNLDGGSSTQLYTKIGKFELRRPGFNSVANAIVVLPRNTATQ